MISYVIATIVSIVILTNIALKAINLITRFSAFERHIEMVTGAVILLVGVWMLTE